MRQTFRDYLRALGQYPLLTAEEELELGRRVQAGDKAAREKLINSNLRLVVSIAKHYQNPHFTLEDLIAEGNLGLINAVNRYNPDLGYRFSTCATPWIKQAISKAITDKGRNIRVPAHIYQLLSKYRRALAELGADGHTITDEELCKKLDITKEKLELLRNWKRDTVSLSTPLGDDSDDTLEDLAPDKGKTPDAIAEENDLSRRIQRLISEFKPRTQQIIKLRYGLGDANDPAEYKKEHTLEEIGAIIGITRERVRQIEKDALAQMKTMWSREIK